MNRVMFLAAALLLGACTTPASAPQIVDRSLLDALGGEYDNYLQVWLARQAESDSLPEHAFLRLRPVELTGAMGNAYVASYGVRDAAPAHRLLLLSAAAGGGWLQSAFHLQAAETEADALALAGRGGDPSCDGRWKRDGEAWVGRVAGAQCALGAATEWRIDADGLTWSDAGAQPLSFRRARQFSGWMGVKRERWDPDAADDAWVFMSKFTVHSEGQKVRLVEKDGAPTGYAIQLESLIYQNTDTPVLKLGLIEEASGKTITYVWANPDATRLGMNLRWFQAGLTAIAP